MALCSAFGSSALRADAPPAEKQDPHLETMCQTTAATITSRLRTWKNTLEKQDTDIDPTLPDEIENQFALWNTMQCHQFPGLLARQYNEIFTVETGVLSDADSEITFACADAANHANAREKLVQKARAAHLDSDDMSSAAILASVVFLKTWRVMGCAGIGSTSSAAALTPHND
jgi:hypothetical protein